MRPLLKCILTGLLFLASSPSSLWGQTYPERPITLILPTSPGGTADNINRLVAEKVSSFIGQPIVPEYRPGSGGMIGTEALSRARPDGYTIGFLGAGVVASQGLGKQLPFDVRDFVPVGQFFNLLMALNVRPGLDVHSVEDFVALAKSKPGQMSFGSTGYGGPTHIAAELFMRATGIKLKHVPYKGDPEAFVDLVAGRIDMVITTTYASIPLHQDGRVRILAVSGPARLSSLPDVPTFLESKIEAGEFISFNSWLLPPNTPPHLASKLSDALLQAGKDEGLRVRLSEFGATLVSVSPAELSQRITSEIERYESLSKDTGIRLN